MEMRLQLNEAFKDRFCTIDWLEKDVARKWHYSINAFNDKGSIPGKEVVDEIFKSVFCLIKKHFTLMLIQDPAHKHSNPVYILYYHYE